MRLGLPAKLYWFSVCPLVLTTVEFLVLLRNLASRLEGSLSASLLVKSQGVVKSEQGSFGYLSPLPTVVYHDITVSARRVSGAIHKTASDLISTVCVSLCVCAYECVLGGYTVLSYV